MKRTSFGVLVLQGLVGQGRQEPFNSSFFSVTGQDIYLDYHDIEWFALETNRDHSVIFEIASKYWPITKKKLEVFETLVCYVGSLDMSNWGEAWLKAI